MPAVVPDSYANTNIVQVLATKSTSSTTDLYSNLTFIGLNTTTATAPIASSTRTTIKQKFSD